MKRALNLVQATKLFEEMDEGPGSSSSDEESKEEIEDLSFSIDNER